jgi:hypothetical protein
MPESKGTVPGQKRPKLPFLYFASFVLVLGLIAFSLYTVSKRPPQPLLAQSDKPVNSAGPRMRQHTGTVQAVIPSAQKETLPFWTKLLASPELATPTAQKVSQFLQTGKLQPLREIKRADMESLVQSLSERFTPEEIAARVEDSLKIPPQYLLQNRNIKSSLMGLYDAALGSSEGPNLSQTRLTFTDNCEPDGRITGTTDNIPSGTKRVYAVFENDGNLKNLQHVLAIWRDPSDDSISFTECEVLRPNSRYNYVWLQTKSAWPSGSYQLDLCNPANHSQILVTQSFNVQ